jgi:integrase
MSAYLSLREVCGHDVFIQTEWFSLGWAVVGGVFAGGRILFHSHRIFSVFPSAAVVENHHGIPVQTKKGERMPIRSYQYIFEKLAEQAGVRKLNFHALRHTFAMRAIECGMDVKVIAEILGHKNASITLNRYAHCMLDHKIEMMHKLPRVL